jgi:hypothetical protein
MADDKIYWHPGFYGAAELELVKNKKELIFEREYNLSKEPLRMDLLVIKKRTNIQIENEIGRIFRKYNILEYKSPDDNMTIDDYFKVLGYACTYKGLGAIVDEVPAEEVTVSLFREAYPRELIKKIMKMGAIVEQKYPGIYYVKGIIYFNTQIVVIRQLQEESHSYLRVLSRNAREEDVRRFIEKSEQFVLPGDRQNADAIMQVSVHANRKIYEKMKGEYAMCEALRDLFKDEIEAEKEDAKRKGREEGREEGRLEGRLEGIEQERERNIYSFIEDYIQEGFSKERIIEKLKKHFGLDQNTVLKYYQEVLNK